MTIYNSKHKAQRCAQSRHHHGEVRKIRRTECDGRDRSTRYRRIRHVNRSTSILLLIYLVVGIVEIRVRSDTLSRNMLKLRIV